MDPSTRAWLRRMTTHAPLDKCQCVVIEGDRRTHSDGIASQKLMLCFHEAHTFVARRERPTLQHDCPTRFCFTGEPGGRTPDPGPTCGCRRRTPRNGTA